MNDKLNSFLWGSLVVIGILVVFIGLKTSVEGIEHEKNVMKDLRFVTEINEAAFEFSAWEVQREKAYYMVLPTMFEKSEFAAEVSYDDRFYSVYIDDKIYQNGDVWKDNLKEELFEQEGICQ